MADVSKKQDAVLEFVRQLLAGGVGNAYSSEIMSSLPEKFEDFRDGCFFYFILARITPQNFPDANEMAGQPSAVRQNWVVREGNMMTLMQHMNEYAHQALSAPDTFNLSHIVNAAEIVNSPVWGGDLHSEVELDAGMKQLLELTDIFIVMVVLSGDTLILKILKSLHHTHQLSLSNAAAACITKHALRPRRRDRAMIMSDSRQFSVQRNAVSDQTEASSQSIYQQQQSLFFDKTPPTQSVLQLLRELDDANAKLTELESKLQLALTEKREWESKYKTILEETEQRRATAASEEHLRHLLEKKDETVRSLTAVAEEQSKKIAAFMEATIAHESALGHMKRKLRHMEDELMKKNNEKCEALEKLATVEDELTLQINAHTILEKEIGDLRREMTLRIEHQNGADNNNLRLSRSFDFINSHDRVVQLENELDEVRSQKEAAERLLHVLQRQVAILPPDELKSSDAMNAFMLQVRQAEEEKEEVRNRHEIVVKQLEDEEETGSNDYGKNGNTGTVLGVDMSDRRVLDDLSAQKRMESFSLCSSTCESTDEARREQVVLVSNMLLLGYRNLMLQQRAFLTNDSYPCMGLEKAAKNNDSKPLFIGSLLSRHRLEVEEGLMESNIDQPYKDENTKQEYSLGRLAFDVTAATPGILLRSMQQHQNQLNKIENDIYEEEFNPSDSHDDEESMTEEEEEYEEGEEEEGDEEDELQENILSFTTFPLNGLRGQHIMVVVAFYRFILVGTNRGVVALVEATGTIFRTLSLHSDPISDLSCDADGEYLGSSDKAGVVTVQNLYEDGDCYRKEFDMPIQSLALHPRYARSEDRPILLGGGEKVMLITKTMFLGRRKITVLQERCGKVHLVRWCCPNILAWANDRGVQLYSYSAKALLQFFPRPKDSPELGLYRCSLLWEAPNTLTCAWRDWVQVLQVYELRMEERLRYGTEFMSRTHRVEAMPAIRTHMMTNPYHMCGIAPFGEDCYLVLACAVEQEGCMKDLEVRIVERSTFSDIYRARMQTKYKHPLHFSLAFSYGSSREFPVQVKTLCSSFMPKTTSNEEKKSLLRPPLSTSLDALSESAYFIVCMDSIIKAMPTNSDDHVEYLLDVGRVIEAYEYAKSHTLHRLELMDVGQRLLQYLFVKMRYDEMTLYLSGIVGYDYAEWERWIVQFDQNGVADLLVEVLPNDMSSENRTSDDTNTNNNNNNNSSRDKKVTRISEEYYELVLLRCLAKDVFRFCVAVQRFKDLFRYDVLCRATEVRYNQWNLIDRPTEVTNEQLTVLGDTYGLLLKLNGQHEMALHVLLQVEQSDELFELLRGKKYIAKTIEILPELFARNKEKTIELLLYHLHTTTDEYDEADVTSSPPLQLSSTSLPASSLIGPEAVVRRLERTQRQYLWVYLKALQTREKVVYAELLKTHAQIVSALFIENEPSGLLAFLRENFVYLQKVNEVYALCRKHQMLEEMVFLLARMGKEEEGLRIIVQEMKDMKKAVEFIADIPTRDDQLDLYCKLVHMVLQFNATMASHRGQKYFEHKVIKGETWKSIAEKYNLSEEELRAANEISGVSTSSNGSSRLVEPNSSVCFVPLNLIKALLQSVVNPSISGCTALDPAFVVERLPEDEPIPYVGGCIAAVTRSKANDVRLMKAVVHVATNDVENYYGSLYKCRAAAIRVEPKMSFCSFCNHPTSGSVVVFNCSHVYHARCVISYLAGKNALCVQSDEVDVARFFRCPGEFLRLEVQRTSLHCFLCYQVGEALQ